ncbi:MAG: hypothetical protein IJV00_10270 [Clostridia bacterium]|nr:hypothetical protein [Clostridia bacterium]
MPRKNVVRPDDAGKLTHDEAWWLDVMLEYVAKNTSLAELARARKVSYSTLVKRAKRENWEAERARYRQMVVRKATNRLSSEHVRHYRALLSANDRLARSLETSLKNGEEYIYNAGTKDEVTGKQINVAFLSNVSALIDKTREVADGLLGIMTVQEAEESELERAKIDAGISAVSDGGGVIVLPPIAGEEFVEEE